MQFFKNLFQDKSVVGLSGLRKQPEYLKITVPPEYRKTYFIKPKNNYILNF